MKKRHALARSGLLLRWISKAATGFKTHQFSVQTKRSSLLHPNTLNCGWSKAASVISYYWCCIPTVQVICCVVTSAAVENGRCGPKFPVVLNSYRYHRQPEQCRKKFTPPESCLWVRYSSLRILRAAFSEKHRIRTYMTPRTGLLFPQRVQGCCP